MRLVVGQFCVEKDRIRTKMPRPKARHHKTSVGFYYFFKPISWNSVAFALYCSRNSALNSSEPRKLGVFFAATTESIYSCDALASEHAVESLSSISLGVPAGANSPHQIDKRIGGPLSSSIVCTSGIDSARSYDSTASGFRPNFAARPILSTNISTCPPKTERAYLAPPSWGTYFTLTS